MIETFDRILLIVVEVTGIPKSRILSSNCEECVDARHILIYILSEHGFSDTKIAEFLGITRPCACMSRNSFRYRRKRYFVNLNYEIIHQKVFGSKEVVTAK